MTVTRPARHTGAVAAVLALAAGYMSGLALDPPPAWALTTSPHRADAISGALALYFLLAWTLCRRFRIGVQILIAIGALGILALRRIGREDRP
jgi:hypothetical protein